MRDAVMLDRETEASINTREVSEDDAFGTP